jgi:hypothetical protein
LSHFELDEITYWPQWRHEKTTSLDFEMKHRIIEVVSNESTAVLSLLSSFYKAAVLVPPAYCLHAIASWLVLIKGVGYELNYIVDEYIGVANLHVLKVFGGCQQGN